MVHDALASVSTASAADRACRGAHLVAHTAGSVGNHLGTARVEHLLRDVLEGQIDGETASADVTRRLVLVGHLRVFAVIAAHVVDWRRFSVLCRLGPVAYMVGAGHGHIADAAEGGFAGFLGCNARSLRLHLEGTVIIMELLFKFLKF